MSNALARARTAARKHNAPATLQWEEWTAILQLFHQQCAYGCGRLATTVDHFIPISRGGGTTSDNCVPCCRSCNQRKGNDLPQDCKLSPAWIERIQSFLHQQRLRKQQLWLAFTDVIQL